MRILHTSDWHLGRTLHGTNLHPHQEAFHDWLVALTVEREVDVVVIPGDVYDRAVPSVEAVRLLGRALVRLAEHATVVLTPGNHDSADRLGFASTLMRRGVHIMADVAGIDHPVEVHDEHGAVLFFGLPYLEPDLMRVALAAEGAEPLGRSHEAVTRAAMQRVLARLDAHAETDADQAWAAARPRSVVLAHTFVAGGSGSDSERSLSVGGVDSVPAAVLQGVDYVALGHLHGCQDMTRAVVSGVSEDAATGSVEAAGTDGENAASGAGEETDGGGAVIHNGPGAATTAWYSGSPLAFSFSEKDQRKAVLIVDLGAVRRDGTADITVERVATPVPRRLTELRGTLEEVLARAEVHGEDWIKAVITDPARPPHLQEHLGAAYPHLLHTEYAPEGRVESGAAPVVRREADPLEVMDEFVGFVTGGEPTPAEHDVLSRAYDAARARRQEAS